VSRSVLELQPAPVSRPVQVSGRELASQPALVFVLAPALRRVLAFARVPHSRAAARPRHRPPREALQILTSSRFQFRSPSTGLAKRFSTERLPSIGNGPIERSPADQTRVGACDRSGVHQSMESGGGRGARLEGVAGGFQVSEFGIGGAIEKLDRFRQQQDRR